MKEKSEELQQTTAIINGDKASFDKLYTSEYKRALFYVNQYVKDLVIAQDITQDSFLSLWEKRRYIDPELPLLPYLYSILKNKTINQLRKLSNDRRIKGELSKREYRANIRALMDETSDVVIKFQLEEHLGRALRELPEKISDTFFLSRIKGLSYNDISEKKGVSVKVVEYHVTQALKLLKSKLKDFL